MPSASTQGTSALDKLTYINIGDHGTLSGKLGTTSADVDAILQHLRKPEIKKVVLHFHGGLVNDEAGQLTAAEMVPLYQRAGSHPVVFIWETGFLQTIEKNITSINQTKLFQKILAYAVQQLAKILHIPVPGRGPDEAEPISDVEAKINIPGGLESYEAGARGGIQKLDAAKLDLILPDVQAEVGAQLENELVQDAELASILRDEVPRTDLLNKNAVTDPVEPASRGFLSVAKLAIAITKIVYNTAHRYLQKREHGFGPTVVEETLRELYMADFGAWVWSGIKDAAEQMWESNNGLSGKNLHGGRYFLEGLAAVQKDRPSLIIDLVGHSAGSIAICHLLKTATGNQITLKIRNVIFMAPACTSSLFLKEIARQPGRYQQFRMFTMNDQFETANHLVSIIYDRSLLYLIAGILEPDTADMPIAGMMRFTTGAAPFGSPDLIEVRDFLFPATPQRIVLAKTSVTGPNAPAGFRSNATRHQDFNTETDTRESLVAMIQ